MKLYNCQTQLEKDLKAIDLKDYETKDIKQLALDIRKDYELGHLENDIVVIDALTEIALELAERTSDI